jgi:hypothetical protein
MAGAASGPSAINRAHRDPATRSRVGSDFTTHSRALAALKSGAMVLQTSKMFVSQVVTGGFSPLVVTVLPV